MLQKKKCFRMTTLNNQASHNLNAVVFGPAGNLGPTWVSTLNDLKYRVFTFGIDEPKNMLVHRFSQCDLRTVSIDVLAKHFEEIKPSSIVVNSGIDARPGRGLYEIEDFEIDSWQEIMDVNVIGVVKILNAVLKSKISPVKIVVIGSLYSIVSPNPELYSHYENGQGVVKHPAYSASKAALLGVLKQYASHLAPKGIYVNMLSPGGILGNQDEEFVRKFNSKTPLGRLGTKTELSSALEFLVNPKSSYLVGHNLIVDGGYSLW